MEKEIHCQLTGEDGNAIAIVSRVSKALRQAQACPTCLEDYRARALAGTYEDLLTLSRETLDKAGISYS